MGQVVQLIGALLILSAYIASQQNRMRLDSAQFLGLNTVGAGILAVVAAVNRDLGFLLLEGVWAWVSARGLRRVLKAEREAKRAKSKSRSKRPPSDPVRRRRGPNPLRRVE
ncbi:MAG: hypothetical protein AB1679_31370 [Actinomycetota bacterium]|jgi:hypothetical protein